MDRRKFLIGSGLGLASAAGFAKAGSVQAATQRRKRSLPKPLATQSNDLTPFDTSKWSDTTLRHLLRRAMFGVPLSQFLEAKKNYGSMDAIIDKLITEPPIPDIPNSYMDSIVYLDPMNINQKNEERSHSMQVANWWMDLILQEHLSIREHMTLLWSNHFVVGSDIVQKTPYQYTYNQTLRRNALGNLKTFVTEISQDPGMILYLNCDQNYDGLIPGTSTQGGKHINENYARELQELFTLGIYDPVSGKPNYTEEDVQQAAKALSGWYAAVYDPFVGNFSPNSHNNDDKKFLGKTGNWGLSDIIDIIFSYTGPTGANRPGFNAAYWFSQKIYMELVYYVPNPGVVTAMANVMLDNNFEIKPVLKALLSSAHFYDESVIGAQIKSPINFIASLVREFGLDYTRFDPKTPPKGTIQMGAQTYVDTNVSLSQMIWYTAGPLLGQLLLDPPNVKGWAGARNWISTGTFSAREKFAHDLLSYPPSFDGTSMSGNIKIAFTNPVVWAQSVPDFVNLSLTQVQTGLTEMILNRPLGPKESAALNLVLDPNGLDLQNDYHYEQPWVAAFAQALAQLPEFQLV